MVAKDLKNEEPQMPLWSRLTLYATQNDLRTLVVKIPWDLNIGPGTVLPDPRGEPFPGEDGENVLRRLDEMWPFAAICYLFRQEASPSEVVEFLRTFDNRPEQYKKFLNVFKYLYSIEANVPSKISLARGFLYFLSLNGLFDPPQNQFDYLFAHFKKEDSPITKNALKGLKKQYDKEHSLSKKYQSLFEDCLTEEEQRHLLQHLGGIRVKP